MRARFGGVEFGDRLALLISGFDPSGPELRTNDHLKPFGDGALVGRDYLGDGVWTFNLATNVRDEVGALAKAGALASAWRDPNVRLRPNVTVPLSYEVVGRWRRVYGRPGPITDPVSDVHAKLGVAKIVASFRVTDPNFYDDALTTVRLTIVPESSGGFVFPLVFPISSRKTTGKRAGLVDNRGDVASPLSVTFHGPARNPKVVAAAGWEVGITGTLAYDQSVTVDARAGTVTRNDGANLAGRLTRATQLTKAVIPAGSSELTFTAIDETGTAKVDLSWRNSYSTI